MSETRLNKIRARLDAAIRGPWRPHLDDEGWCVLLDHGDGAVVATIEAGRTAEGDTLLIAHAPADLAHLLGEIARLTRELEEARGRVWVYQQAVEDIAETSQWPTDDREARRLMQSRARRALRAASVPVEK